MLRSRTQSTARDFAIDVDAPRSAVGAWRWVLPVLIGLVTAVFAWVRLGAATRNTVWAEDGHIFLQQYLEFGAKRTLFLDYAGYLHVVPRLLTDIAVHVGGIDRFAMNVSALSCAVVGAVGAAIFIVTRNTVSSPIVRLLLAFVPALVPLGPVEIAGNLANLHSYLLFLAPFVLMSHVRSWTRGIALGVVGLLSGLTEIQIVFFAPLAFVGLRSRRRWPVLAGYAIGVGAQFVTTFLHPRYSRPAEKNTPADIALGYLIQPVGGSSTGDMHTLGRLLAEHGIAVVAVPAVGVLAVIVGGFWLGRARQRILLGAMLWGSLLVWVISVWVNPNKELAFAEFSSHDFMSLWTFRYTAASSLFVIAAVLVAADAILSRPRTSTRIVAGIAMAAVVWTFAGNFVVHDSTREDGPQWEQQVDRYEPVCERSPSENAVIQVAPDPTWATRVPCVLVDAVR